MNPPRRRGRPAELGVKRTHRVEIQLADAELAEIRAALLPSEPLADYIRRSALAWTRMQREG